MEQIERIKAMEALLNECADAVSRYAAETERFEAVQEKIRALSDYYGSGDWYADCEAQEEGRLPEGLKCGVLSEDLAYSAIIENRDTAIRMLEIATGILKKT